MTKFQKFKIRFSIFLAKLVRWLCKPSVRLCIGLFFYLNSTLCLYEYGLLYDHYSAAIGVSGFCGMVIFLPALFQIIDRFFDRLRSKEKNG